jgi:hypothetical protein
VPRGHHSCPRAQNASSAGCAGSLNPEAVSPPGRLRPTSGSPQIGHRDRSGSCSCSMRSSSRATRTDHRTPGEPQSPNHRHGRDAAATTTRLAHEPNEPMKPPDRGGGDCDDGSTALRITRTQALDPPPRLALEHPQGSAPPTHPRTVSSRRRKRRPTTYQDNGGLEQPRSHTELGMEGSGRRPIAGRQGGCGTRAVTRSLRWEEASPARGRRRSGYISLRRRPASVGRDPRGGARRSRASKARLLGASDSSSR